MADIDRTPARAAIEPQPKQPSSKYDVTNPLPGARVLHDANQRAVHIAPGETKYDVEITDAEAERFKNLKPGTDVTLAPASGDHADEAERDKNPDWSASPKRNADQPQNTGIRPAPNQKAK